MTKSHGQAVADIEITPEMLAAGRAAFGDWLSGGHAEDAVVGMPTDHELEMLLAAVFCRMASSIPAFSQNEINPIFRPLSSTAASENSSSK